MESKFTGIIKALNYDFSRFEIMHFLNHVQRLRNKDIILTGVNIEPGLYGLWIPALTADYVFYNSQTHAVHRIHIILHELAHMLLGHHTQSISELFSGKQPLTITLDEELLKKMGLMRRIDEERRKNGQEEEAEAFVRELQYHILRAGRGSYLTHSSTSITALAPFTGSLSFED